MIAENNIILNNIQINQKIKRIAYQIYESNSSEKEVIIAGIVGNGFIFSKKIGKVLEEISTITVTLCEVIIDKKKTFTTNNYLYCCKRLQKQTIGISG